MVKLGFSLENSYPLPMGQVMDILADAGFCAVSPVWQPDADIAETVRLAARRNLAVQSLHGPVRGLQAMWSREGTAAQPMLRSLLQSAAICADASIPLLVVHSWNGLSYTFRQEDLFFNHFDVLVDFAEKAGIRIAFENMEAPEYLAALMAHYRGCQSVGLCWDSGHELCFAQGQDLLSPYGDRLLMTHLNDNLGITDPAGKLTGTDDLHLLPHDGIADWDNIVCRLKGSKRQDILNFELKIRPKGDRCTLDLYSGIPLQRYLREACQRARDAVKEYFD